MKATNGEQGSYLFCYSVCLVRSGHLLVLLAGGTSSSNLSPLASITLVQNELGVHLEQKEKVASKNGQYQAS